MIHNVVFDFGGVIFDLDYDGAVAAFKRMGLADADKRLDRFHQRGVFEQLELGRITTEQFVAELSVMCSRGLTQSEVQEAWLGYVGGKVNEQKLAYIDSLRQRGYRTFLLSNTNPFVQSWAESSSFSTSGRPLSSFLEKCYTSFELGIMKPDAAIFLHMLEVSGLQPEETIFLDDSPANIAAADALGIKTLLVEKNEDWHDALEACLLDGKR